MAFFDPSRPQDFVFISGTKVCSLCDFVTYGLVLIDYEALTLTQTHTNMTLMLTHLHKLHICCILINKGYLHFADAHTC